MSMLPSESGLAAAGDEALRRALERAGWRCTRQRAAVYAHLRSDGSMLIAQSV